jgi:hypothetical protein
MPNLRTLKEPVLTRWIYAAAAVGTLLLLLLVLGKFYLVSRPAAEVAEPRLEGALRPGAAEFDEHRPRIVLERPRAAVAPRALGDRVVELNTSVRNETGRAISGLELRGAVLDSRGEAVRERTVIVVPGQRTALAPGETMDVRILLEGLDPDSDRAETRVEVTGFRLG